jgi:hypothetical protein
VREFEDECEMLEIVGELITIAATDDDVAANALHTAGMKCILITLFLIQRVTKINCSMLEWCWRSSPTSLEAC